MDQIFWVMAIISIVIVGTYAGMIAFREHQQKSAVNKLYDDFMNLIETEYKARLSGSNRFIVNQESLKLIYLDATPDEIEGLFKRLVDAKVIDRDPVDQAWSLR